MSLSHPPVSTPNPAPVVPADPAAPTTPGVSDGGSGILDTIKSYLPDSWDDAVSKLYSPSGIATTSLAGALTAGTAGGYLASQTGKSPGESSRERRERILRNALMSGILGGAIPASLLMASNTYSEAGPERGSLSEAAGEVAMGWRGLGGGVAGALAGKKLDTALKTGGPKARRFMPKAFHKAPGRWGGGFGALAGLGLPFIIDSFTGDNTEAGLPTQLYNAGNKLVGGSE